MEKYLFSLWDGKKSGSSIIKFIAEIHGIWKPGFYWDGENIFDIH